MAPSLRASSLAARRDRAPGRDARGLVHGGRPARGVARRRRATRETPPGADARRAIAGALPTLEDEHLVTARAAYAVVLEVELPRETMDLMGLEQLCAALAVDVGAHAADATCAADAETAPAPAPR